MAELERFREQFRQTLMPEYTRLADQTIAGAQGRADYYRGQEPTLSERYAKELEQVRLRQADKEKSELGRVEAGAAAAGAQGGVVTANRLMTQKAIEETFAPQRSDVSLRKEDALSNLRDTIAKILYEADQQAREYRLRGTEAVEDAAKGAYDSAVQQEQFNQTLAEQRASRAAAARKAAEDAQFKVTPDIIGEANNLMLQTESENPSERNTYWEDRDRVMSVNEANRALASIKANYGVDTATAKDIFRRAWSTGGWKLHNSGSVKGRVTGPVQSPF